MSFVRLAGGLLWRDGPRGPRLAVIHRPRQGDWSLPKGRLDPDEGWEQAALREVEEETGCAGQITSFAGAAVYVLRKTPRVALYWNLSLLREGVLDAGSEVDELRWLLPLEAIERLDHEPERRLLKRSSSNTGASKGAKGLAARIAAARAEVLSRLLSLEAEADLAGMGPGLELLDRAEEALQRGDEEEVRSLLSAAARVALLGLSGKEVALRAQVLREEARALAPWRKRAIRRILPANETVSAEAVYLAAQLRDEANEGSSSPRPRGLILTAASLGVIGAVIAAAAPHLPISVLAFACGMLGGCASWLVLSVWRSGSSR
jgi:8-oxo-dGTP diphosphatase